MTIKQKIALSNIHKYFFISLIILLLAQKLLKFSGFSFITYLDELLFLYLFISLLFNFINLKINKFIILFSISYIYMITVSIISSNSSTQYIVIQSLVHLKFFIFYYIIDKYLNLKEIKSILYFLFIFTLLGVTVHILIQENLNHFFLQKVDYRSGLLRIGGFQGSPNLLGLTLGLFYLFFILNKKISFSIMIFATMIFTVLIFITGSRSGLIPILIGIIFYYLSLNTKYKIYMLPIISFLLITFLYMVFSTDILNKTINNISTLNNNVVDSGYIRGIMIYYGFSLFLDNFPFGTGAATFGSVLSEGSIIYNQLGLSNRSFFINMSGVYDSNIASIAGEFGFIGFIIFFILLKYIYKTTKTKKNTFMIHSLFIILIISTISNPIFMNSYPALLFSLFFIYIKKRRICENIDNK